MDGLIETFHCIALVALFFAWALIPGSCPTHVEQIEEAREAGYLAGYWDRGNVPALDEVALSRLDDEPDLSAKLEAINPGDKT